MSQHHFSGRFSEGGKAFLTEANNDFQLEPLFVKFNTQTGRKELIGTHTCLFYNIEEFNRAHPVVQNEFYSFGNGRLIMNGFNVPLGQDGYSCAFATGNDPRNQKSSGAFTTDEALLSRFGFVLNLDDPNYRVTEEDEYHLNKIKPANPGVLMSGAKRDISDKIIAANKEIVRASLDLGVEAEAVFAYLSRGLSTCPGYMKSNKTKDKKTACRKKDIDWPHDCESCVRKSSIDNKTPLCKKATFFDPRVLNATRRYASALDYLARVKDPNANIDPAELVFTAFELTGAYQGVLNEKILELEFKNRNNTMMRQVVDALKSDFKRKQDFIIPMLETARQGGKIIAFYEVDSRNGKNILYANPEADKAIREKLSEGAPEKLVGKRISLDDAFTDNQDIPMSWVPQLAKFESRDAELRRKK